MSAPYRKVRLKSLETLQARKKNQNNQSNQFSGGGLFPFLENASSFFPVSHSREGFWIPSCSWATYLMLHLKTSWKFLARAEESSSSWTVGGSVRYNYTELCISWIVLATSESIYHKVLLQMHGLVSSTLYVGSFSKSRHCTSCHIDPNCYEVYYSTDTKFLAEMYIIALKTTAWMWHATFSECTISQAEIFFDAVVKSEIEKLVCSKQLFSVFSQAPTLLSPTQQSLDSFIFKHFWPLLTPFLWADSPHLQCLGEVTCLKQTLEVPLNWFVFIVFYCLTCSSHVGLLPEITCRYILHAANPTYRGIATGIAMQRRREVTCTWRVQARHAARALHGRRQGCQVLLQPSPPNRAKLQEKGCGSWRVMFSKTSEELFEQLREISLEILWWNW